MLGEQRLLDALVAAFRFRWPNAEVLTATDAETGLRLATDRTPNAVVLDADLPDRSGFDVLADIRRASEAPVVLLTADNRQLDAARSAAPGGSLYLRKPFSTRALITFLAQVGAADGVHGPRRGYGSRVRIGAVLTFISAAVLLAATLPFLGAIGSVEVEKPSHETLRYELVCELPPDQMTDRFKDLGWCEMEE